MTRVVYPGSFDPVTMGHLDVATRASTLFDELIIAVYDAPPKRLLFTTAERVDLWKGAIGHLDNVTVEPYVGLTVDFARQRGARAIVRGLRMNSDFENEFEMALMNRNLAPGLEVVCLMTSAEYQFLSSSLLKEVAGLGGNIRSLVPPHVAVALESKLRVATKGGAR